jgi:hypothetical protein
VSITLLTRIGFFFFSEFFGVREEGKNLARKNERGKIFFLQGETYGERRKISQVKKRGKNFFVGRYLPTGNSGPEG